MNPYTVQAAAASKSKSSKFKQKILLDRCHLVDRVDDECCFELQQLTNGAGRYTRTDKYTLFILDTQKDKFHWMAMLCYTQYKFTIDRLLQIMIEEHNHLNPLPIPPKSYIFDQLDSPETILFDVGTNATAAGSVDFNPYLKTKASWDGWHIKAATLVKLVERLTHHLYLHPKFSNTFLMFFREFTTPRKLLELLTVRYNVPDLSVADIATQSVKSDFM